MPRPARPWFRSWSESLDSAKIFNLGTARPDLFFAWNMLLCLANVTRPRGYLPADVADISFALRESPQKTAEILSQLSQLKFIDLKGKRLYMHDWKDWQPDSDANLTPARATRNQFTPKERAKNALRTPLERLDPDTDTDPDKETDPEPEPERGGLSSGEVPVVRAFERCFGRLLGPMEIENIHRLEEEHPRERIDYALREAADLHSLSVRYVQRICENQAQSGDNRERPTTQRTNASSPPAEQRDPYGLGERELV